MRRYIPVALTIAGSDSGGGAGIQADLKTFAALGVHGVVAITSITAQNTYEVRAIYDLPPKMIEEQIRAVVEDMGVDAAKTGMLSNSDIIKVVARMVKEYSLTLVVDPVMIAKSSARLLREDAISTLVNELFPLATVITPNKYEAEVIAEIKINSIEDAKEAARIITEKYGPRAVIVKGGHIDGEKAIDILYYNGKYWLYESNRITNGCTHGTGCSYSAAITAELAKGKSIPEAVKTAKEFITLAIRYGLKIGKGHCPVNPIAWLEIKAERYNVITNIKQALDILINNGDLISKYVPEVQMNLVMALPKHYAKSIDDVAGVKGRIVRFGDTIKPVGPIEFGASKHLARAVLKIMEYNSEIRAAMNIKYDEKVVNVAKSLGYTLSYYDRREEPPKVKEKEGATIPWGIEVAIKRVQGKTPDIVYHLGDWGKEPMINIFGSDAVDVVRKLINILKHVESKITKS